MTELVFSTQKRGFEAGRHYQNPKYFDGRFPHGVSHIYVLGDWPKVVRAADEFGINCTQLKEGAPISWKDGVAPVGPGQKLVEIPDTWKQFGNPRIIQLAADIAQRDVANRKQAVRIIEDELDRRVAADEHLTPDTDDADDDTVLSPESPGEGGDFTPNEQDPPATGGDTEGEEPDETDNESDTDEEDEEPEVEKPAKKSNRRNRRK